MHQGLMAGPECESRSERLEAPLLNWCSHGGKRRCPSATGWTLIVAVSEVSPSVA